MNTAPTPFWAPRFAEIRAHLASACVDGQTPDSDDEDYVDNAVVDMAERVLEHLGEMGRAEGVELGLGLFNSLDMSWSARDIRCSLHSDIVVVRRTVPPKFMRRDFRDLTHAVDVRVDAGLPLRIAQLIVERIDS